MSKKVVLAVLAGWLLAIVVPPRRVVGMVTGKGGGS